MEARLEEQWRRLIRDVPDFPVKGILFRDITTLLKDGETFAQVVDRLVERYRGEPIDLVAAVESRGFIFGAPLATRLGLGFIPIRKPGKLPAEHERVDYELEYGKAALEMHNDAVRPGQRVLIVDDLLATGGTVAAAKRLVERAGGVVTGFAFLVELAFLNGRNQLAGYDVFSLLVYDD